MQPTTCFLLLTQWFFADILIITHAQVGPKFTRRVKTEYTVYERMSVKLRCPVTGTDDPPDNRTLVIWYHDGRPIDSTDREWARFYIKQEKHLLIRNVSKQDAGVYICWAYNEYGNVKARINLAIKTRKTTKKEVGGQSPQFKASVKSRLTFRKGESAKLRCHSTGDPEPHIQWLKNGEPYSKNNKRAGVSPSGWTLNLRYMGLQDSGTYMCRVSNKFGHINRTFNVNVKARVEKPIIEDTEDSRVRVSRGKNAVLDCRAASVGKPSFKWRRYGNKFTKFSGSRELPTSDRSRYRIHKLQVNDVNIVLFEATLVILNVTKYDEGKYICIVQNRHGSDKLSKYLLVTEDKPISTVPPLIENGGKGVTQIQSSSKNISIEVVAGIMISFLFLTAICVVIIVILCRKRRMDLEHKFVSKAYKPEEFLQLRPCLSTPREGDTKQLSHGENTAIITTKSVSQRHVDAAQNIDRTSTPCVHPDSGQTCLVIPQHHTNSNTNHRSRESVI